jgi:DnaK suppressor protein
VTNPDLSLGELSEAQRAELQADLLSLREELQRSLSLSSQGAKPVDLDEPIGRLSRMDAMQQQSMLKANRSAAQLRLQQVEGALVRQRAGEYGECQNCGENIGFPRLKARPEAPFCLSCQGVREKRG